MIFAAITLVFLADGIATEYQHIDFAEAEARARSCALEQVEAQYDEDIQTEILTVTDADISDPQLRCLAEVMDLTFYWVDVPERYRATYYELERIIAEPRNRARALEVLAENGLAPPPTYDPERISEADYASLLENHCGPAADGALSSDFGPTTLSPEFMANQADFEDQTKRDASTCIFFSAAAAGFPLGFIGNDKTPENPAED